MAWDKPITHITKEDVQRLIEIGQEVSKKRCIEQQATGTKVFDLGYHDDGTDKYRGQP